MTDTLTGWDATVTPAGGSTFGAQQFDALGGAASDIFGGFADIEKSEGAAQEATNYGLAAQLAGQNEQFAIESTQIKELQAGRQLMQAQGSTQADVAGAGMAASGSALDIMKMNAAQGALTAGVVAKQGLITEAGYAEQQQAYTNLQQAAKAQESGDMFASIGSFVAGAAKVAEVAAPMLLA